MIITTPRRQVLYARCRRCFARLEAAYPRPRFCKSCRFQAELLILTYLGSMLASCAIGVAIGRSF